MASHKRVPRVKQQKIAIRQYRPSLPFYHYSSFNKKGGRTHPRVARLRNQALDLWAAGASYATISEQLDLSISAIVSYIKWGKRLKDHRVKRPYPDKKIALAALRRQRIKQMAEQGMQASEIARLLDCSTRLVEIRIKEMAE